jgi:serine protease
MLPSHSLFSLRFADLFKTLIGLCLLFQLCLGSAHAQQASAQFILKLKNSVELSSAPSVRRLDKDGEQISTVLLRNNVDAVWVRAGTLGTQVLRWGAGVRSLDYQALLNRLASDPDVEYAIIDRPVRLQSTSPNDSSFSSQWALLSTSGQGGAKFNLAWDLIKGSASVVIAVIDTGVVFDTAELKGRLLPGYDFIADSSTANDGDGRDSDPSDPGNWITSAESQSGTFAGCSVKDSNWHGTFVSSLIAANTNNSSGVSGADWNAKILPVRALGKCGGLLSDVLDGMLWAAGLDVPGVPTNTTPASVINLSLGGDTTCSTTEQTVVDRVTAAGVLVVASAGNSGGAVEAPAVCNNVMAVGALDRDGSRAAYSSVGTAIDLMAPGGYSYGILGVSNSGTTSPDSATLATKTGTSFAAPMVAAAAGLMRAVDSTLTPAQLITTLKSSASSFLAPKSSTCTASSGVVSCNCTTSVCGSGMLNAYAAVQAVRSTKPLANTSVTANGLSSSEVQQGTVQASALNPIFLKGSASSVTSGRTVASYLWEQTSGPTLLSGTANTADVSLSAPSASADLVFKLTVTDSVGEGHSSYTAIRVIASGDTASCATTSVSSSSTDTVCSASSDSSSSSGSTSTTDSSSSSSSSGSGSGGGGGGALNLFGMLWMAILLACAKRAEEQSKQ